MTAVKKRSTEPADIGEMMPVQLRDGGRMDVHSALERRQRLETMWQLINGTLTPLEAQVMTMHYGQELSLDTVTRLLGLSNPSGAKAYIVSARRKLNAALSK